MALQKLEQEKRYLYVLDQLVKLMKDEGCQVGDQLPPERRISDLTGVSRSSVREALAVLEVAGIIEVRVGHGIYVKSISFRDLDRHASIPSPMDVLELRLYVESKVAGLAAQRRSKPMLNELYAILNEMEQMVSEDDVEGFIGLDQRFHNVLASCTGNEAIEQQVMTIVSHFYQPVWGALMKVYQSKEELCGIPDSFEEHKRILQAVEQQDASEAEAAMWDHLANVQHRLAGETL